MFIPIAHAHGHERLAVDATTHPLLIHHVPGATPIGNTMVAVLIITIALAIYLYVRQRSERTLKPVSIIQKVAWFYAAQFYIITALVYIPGITDDVGNLLGLFKLDLIDDLLHLGSALWATWAAWHSTRQAVWYFKIFGTLYGLDGIVGLITQRGILDGGVVLYQHPGLDLLTTIAANLPHILIGSVAVYVGFFLSRRVANART